MLLLEEEAPVSFEWKAPNRKPVKITPGIQEGKLKIPPAPESPIDAAFFAASHTYSATETAGRFSALSRKFEEGNFIKLFEKHFKNIADLSIEVLAGSAMLYARVRDVPEKIPIGMASGGMNKLAAILLAIPDRAGGVIFIDEIESGIYYKRMPMVWNSILELATEYDCQIFASTHSAECIGAAAALAKKNPSAFSVMRTVLESGATRVRHFGGDKLVTALEENIEIR
jgi:hypothetical protein